MGASRGVSWGIRSCSRASRTSLSNPGSAVAVGALLQLRVDVHRHFRVGVPDLAHNPLHVELAFGVLSSLVLAGVFVRAVCAVVGCGWLRALWVFWER
jgi:hypothetical protein